MPAIPRSGAQRGQPRLPAGRTASGRVRTGLPSAPRGDRNAASWWYRWGVAMARHRRVTLMAWVILLGCSAALYPSLKDVLSQPDYSVDGSQSARLERLLSGSAFRGAGDEQDVIVFFSRRHRASDPAFRRVVARVLHSVRSLDGVASVAGPYGVVAQVSADGHAALARLALNGSSRQRFQSAGRLQDAIARAGGRGVSAWLTGYSSLAKDVARIETADSERAETIGVPLAFMVLVLALGAFAAAAVPLMLAGSGVLATSGLIALLARVLDFDVFMLTIVTMIGVGIGIDYSLFIVSRFREELARLPVTPRRERRRIEQAVGMTIATSGRTVLYSGVIVTLSLTSLLVVRAPVFREFAIGISATVVCTLLAALTLLPAALAQLGDRVNAGSLPRRLLPADTIAGAPAGEGGWARWAMAMMRRPVVVGMAVLLPLLAAIVPVAGLRTGIAVDTRPLAATPSGKGAQVLGRSFSAGMTAPIEVTVMPDGPLRDPLSSGAQSGVRGASGMLMEALRRDRRTAAVSLHRYGTAVLLTVVPRGMVGSSASSGLVRRLRDVLAPVVRSRYGTQVLVGGWPAQSADASSETTGRLPLVLAITLGMAMLFLLIVLRSIVLPLKAIAMNMLATGATLGLVVLVFQQGHGERLLNFSSTGFIQAYLPLSMFVLLFGLSMDYEIFLIRRMQEAWRETADNRRSVASGVAHTGRPISAAAAIMVAVFGSGMTANALELKEFGFALAVAIAIDATLIRLALVPALMCLLDARNWWLPDRLARILPRLELN
jgi:putative drug exporter of the RND superfamily